MAILRVLESNSRKNQGGVRSRRRIGQETGGGLVERKESGGSLGLESPPQKPLEQASLLDRKTLQEDFFPLTRFVVFDAGA